MSNDPVKDLALVVKLAEERRLFGDMLKRVRSISENDAITLGRLMSERAYVVGLIDRHFEDRENHFRKSFDFQYTDNFIGAIEHVVSTTRQRALHDALEAVRETMDDKKERRPGHVMAAIGELMEKKKV